MCYKNTYNCGISSIFTHDLQYLYFMATSKEMTSGRLFLWFLILHCRYYWEICFQQTYSLVDAAIVGQFFWYKWFGCCGSRYFGGFLILGFLQRLLGIRHSGGTEVRCEGLRHDAAAGVGQSATSRSNVGCDSDCYQSLLQIFWRWCVPLKQFSEMRIIICLWLL